MNVHDLLERLSRYPVFDLVTFENISDLKHETAKMRLFRLKDRGYVQMIFKDRYSVHHDPMLIASRIFWPSYISLTYALYKHGLTTQSPHIIEVLTTRKTFRSELTIDNMGIEFIKIDPRFLFGYDKVRYGDHEIFLATPEKALLDGLLFKRISASESMDILRENINRIDIQEMVRSTVRCKNSALVKRIGYMLDSLGHDHYRQLHKLTKQTILALDWKLLKKGELNKKWMIIDNLKRTDEVG